MSRMRALDRALQAWRMAKLAPHLRPGDRVLDVGCLDGALFRTYPFLGASVGLDPLLPEPRRVGNAVLRPGHFPEALSAEERFDAITALALLEHVPDDALDDFVAAMKRHLVPGGLALLTVPAPAVDRILDVLLALKLADGMSVEEHHGYEVSATSPLFRRHGFTELAHQRFQLGLNHLFVFRAPELR